MSLGLLAVVVLLDLAGRGPTLAAGTRIGRGIHVFLQNTLEQPGHHPVIGNQIRRQGRLLTRLNQAEGFLLQSAGGGIELFDPAQDLGIRGVRRKLALEKPLGVMTGTLTLVVVQFAQSRRR